MTSQQRQRIRYLIDRETRRRWVIANRREDGTYPLVVKTPDERTMIRQPYAHRGRPRLVTPTPYPFPRGIRTERAA